MGIENRDYYRSTRSGPSILVGASVVKYLIGLNVIVFILQLVSVADVRMSRSELLDRLKSRDPEQFKDLTADDIPLAWCPVQHVSIVQQWLELDTLKVVNHGQVWRLLTHAFCHDRGNLLHIVINMLCLYWFGVAIELKYGSREFLIFYLTAAVVAGAAFVGIDLATGSTAPAIGASGAVMGVMMVYAIHYPRQIILLFFIIPLQIRWAMALFVIYDLYPVLSDLLGRHVMTGIANAAHLGGAAFGFVYVYFGWRLERLFDWSPKLRWRRAPRLRVVRADEPHDDPEPDMRRLDEILAKISRSGRESLTDEERAILQGASERLKRRRDGVS